MRHGRSSAGGSVAYGVYQSTCHLRWKKTRNLSGSRVGYVKGEKESSDCAMRACRGVLFVGHGPKTGAVATGLQGTFTEPEYDAYFKRASRETGDAP